MSALCATRNCRTFCNRKSTCSSFNFQVHASYKFKPNLNRMPTGSCRPATKMDEQAVQKIELKMLSWSVGVTWHDYIKNDHVTK